MAKKIRNFFYNLNLRQKSWMFFTGLVSIYILILGIIFAGLMWNHIDEYARENNRKNLIAIRNNMNAQIDEINNFSKLIMSNKHIEQFLMERSNQPKVTYKEAVSEIYKIQNTFSNPQAVFLFGENGNYLKVDSGLTHINYTILHLGKKKKDVRSRKGDYYISLNGDGVFSCGNNKNILSFMREVRDTEQFKNQALLAINFPVTVLEDTYEGFKEGNVIYTYMTVDGKEISSSKKGKSDLKYGSLYVDEADTQVYQKIKRQAFREQIVTYARIPKTDLILISEESVSLFADMSTEWGLIFLSFLTMTILSFVLIQKVMAKFITTPIQKMVEAMQWAKDGWLRRVSIKTYHDEIGVLKDSYNTMLVEMNNLISELVNKEKQVQKSEIEIIQQQIKPHFLYNTIESIASMAVENGNMDMYDALETLGSFYRKFLSKGSDEVSIETEVEIVKDYLKLEKMRYGDIFELEIEIDQLCRDKKVPKLLLQPLVENSLHHGIRMKGEKGLIQIRVWNEEQHIYIMVYDTGIGMTQEQMEGLMKNSSKSFGFKKTIERLQYYEGRDDVFCIQSELGLYTKILLNLERE